MILAPDLDRPDLALPFRLNHLVDMNLWRGLRPGLLLILPEGVVVDHPLLKLAGDEVHLDPGELDPNRDVLPLRIPAGSLRPAEQTLVDVLKVMGRRRLERDEEIDIGRPRNSGALRDGADGNDPVLISVRPLSRVPADVASREVLNGLSLRTGEPGPIRCTRRQS